jgi:hypothetical protein
MRVEARTDSIIGGTALKAEVSPHAVTAREGRRAHWRVYWYWLV